MPKISPSSHSPLFTRILRQLFSSSSTRKQREIIESLREEVALLSSYSTDTIYRLDYATMRYSYISPNVTRLLGYSAAEIAQLNVRSLIEETRLIDNGITKVESYAGLELMRKNREVSKWQADYLMRTKDGHSIWVSDISYPVFDSAGKVTGSVGSLRDISGRVYAELQMKEAFGELLTHDAQTGLYTLKAYHARLDEEMKRLKRLKGEVSLMIMNIDHFDKLIEKNSTEFADFVVLELSKLIQTCLRETDIAARIACDGFAVILPDTTAEGAFWVMERIRATVGNHSFMTSRITKPVGITLSFGMATAHCSDSIEAQDLHLLADKRLARAKQMGSNQISIDENNVFTQSNVLH